MPHLKSPSEALVFRVHRPWLQSTRSNLYLRCPRLATAIASGPPYCHLKPEIWSLPCRPSSPLTEERGRKTSITATSLKRESLPELDHRVEERRCPRRRTMPFRNTMPCCHRVECGLGLPNVRKHFNFQDSHGVVPDLIIVLFPMPGYNRVHTFSPPRNYFLDYCTNMLMPDKCEI